LRRETYNSKALQNKLISVGSKLDIDGQFTLVLFKIDNFNVFVEKYGEDAKLIKYAIMNICSEVASPDFKTETIDMGEDSVILLLNYIENLLDQESFLNMLQEMQANVAKHLKLSVSLTVSPAEESVFQMGDMYKQVVKASFHRLFYGHGCILFSNTISDLKSKEYEFPIQKEKQLIDYMMTGKANEAKKIYSEIISETSEYPFTVVQLAISHLTLTISNVLNTIKRNNSLVIDLDFDATILSVNHAEIIEEINSQFYELFDDISKKLDEKRSSKHDDLVKKINDMIEEEYSDYNLGLNSIADELNMSPVYISRLYKQLTLKTPTDAISEMRMNKAKELLLNTDYSIADIAEKTGFTNSSYFYRMFKKSNGVTPNDFRKTK
jgi:two-component system response regulator YesN